MTTYRVIWEIDIDADTPREAAQKAREIQLRADSWATVFQVIGADETGHVDLTLEGGAHVSDDT